MPKLSYNVMALVICLSVCWQFLVGMSCQFFNESLWCLVPRCFSNSISVVLDIFEHRSGHKMYPFIPIIIPWKSSQYYGSCSGGSVVSVLDSLPGGCEFDPRLRQNFCPAYFRLLPLQKHVGKVVGGFGKKSCWYWCEKASKHMCIIDHHDMTLAVKVALNPNTTNQPAILWIHVICLFLCPCIKSLEVYCFAGVCSSVCPKLNVKT